MTTVKKGKPEFSPTIKRGNTPVFMDTVKKEHTQFKRHDKKGISNRLSATVKKGLITVYQTRKKGVREIPPRIKSDSYIRAIARALL